MLLRKMQSLGRVELANPVAEAIRKMSNEQTCEDCGNILSEEALDNCGGVCFDCYSKITETDYNPERPR